jgi:predicted RNase H-related nuclease YkuK (DUF458 family)
LTISVGCDSAPGEPIIFVTTIMLYDSQLKKGAHVIYNREIHRNKPMTTYMRLQREYELALEMANFLDERLKSFYSRKDLTEMERKRYKYHLLRNNGLYGNIDSMYEDNVIKNLTLSDVEKDTEFKLVDIHVDYNSKEGYIDKKGNPKHKSNISYKSWVPYVRSLGYRVFVKPAAVAASSAADLLLH